MLHKPEGTGLEVSEKDAMKIDEIQIQIHWFLYILLFKFTESFLIYFQEIYSINLSLIEFSWKGDSILNNIFPEILNNWFFDVKMKNTIGCSYAKNMENRRTIS